MCRTLLAYMREEEKKCCCYGSKTVSVCYTCLVEQKTHDKENSSYGIIQCSIVSYKI